MRRFALLALSLSTLLGLSAARLVAQDKPKDDTKAAAPAKADDTKADDKKGAEAKADDKKGEEKKAEEKKAEEKKAGPEPSKVFQEKLEKARRAFADVVAQGEAEGLIQTSIEPPPFFDVLVEGRATDERTLKDKAGATKGVSPEVFGAWYTGYGKESLKVNYEEEVRIVPPSQGLKALYDHKADVLKPYLAEARKSLAAAAPKPAEAPKPEEKKAEEKKAEEKKAEEKKAEEKKAEEKKEEAKPEEKKAEAKKDEAKPEEKKDDTKKDEPKAEDKKDEAKKDDNPSR